MLISWRRASMMTACSDAGERVFIAVLKGKVLDPVDDIMSPEAPEGDNEGGDGDARARAGNAGSLPASIVLAAMSRLVEPSQ